ncbi:ribbon-helix-helix protein, CopG family [Neisseria sp. Dent CA1/247]|uniref:ribbon-helix-helix protein, CopG family n=1 Tax=Neisseria sp. Dent CA1/247 TaxID=2912675 RepID=UPI001FD417E3|nr:ribbon-helix-helix protein, CopG family [Neisseria sp. Dent CA1/247]UOO76042.1 ribbon-helix-helix protein, CopG family [Neisseria sp. Dent CA1/247]
MALSPNEIQKRSDEKRGVKAKSYKLPKETIELITALAKKTGKSQAAIINEAVRLYANKAV